jgi:hypothetical protein
MGGMPTGIDSLTPRTRARGGGNIGGGIITGSNLGSRTGFSVLDIIGGGMQEELTGGAEKIKKSQLPIKSGKGLKSGNLFQRFLTQVRPGFSLPSVSGVASVAAPFVPSAALAYFNRPKTVEALKYMKEMSRAGIMDETTSPEDLEAYYKELDRLNKVGEEISFKDAFFLDPETKTYPKFLGRTEDRDKLAKAEETKIDMDAISDDILKKAEGEKDFQQKVLEGEKEFKEKKDLNEQNKKELSFDEVVKSEDTFGNEFEKQYKRLQKYIGKDDTSKGELAIALSDAIGTPGTLADKAASLNKFLLSKVRAKKTDKRELAKLAFAAATDLEKANRLAGKQTFEEKRFNKLFKAADVINNKSKYSEEAVSAAQDYLKTTRDIQDLLKDKKGDFTLTGATVAKTISELPKTKRKLAKEIAKGDKARPEKIAEYEQEIALAEAFLSKDLAAIQRLLKSDGGRVNLAESFPGTVGEAAKVQKAPAAQVDKLDFKTLRTRLPAEITDDIVKLLVNDDQALQDFSYIRTQGDVNSFNLKYGVTLVLPPESA